jgi:hypothetical protein
MKAGRPVMGTQTTCRVCIFDGVKVGTLIDDMFEANQIQHSHEIKWLHQFQNAIRLRPIETAKGRAAYCRA